MADDRCDETMTLKVDGPEPYRCTRLAWHFGSHELVQESSGKKKSFPNIYACCGGRIVFLYHQYA